MDAWNRRARSGIEYAEAKIPRMAEELLRCVEIEPRGTASASIIWLHGLGADGNDFVPIVPELGLEPELGVRFVFPHAPAIPVTVNQGMVMPAWYDILGLDFDRRHDAAGIRRSAGALTRLIARETARGVPSERIVLAGFSQGGAIALHTGLRHPDPLAGIVALSTYLVLPDELADQRSDANASTPIFQAHGTYDPMIAVERGVETREQLRAAGYAVTWHDYPMQHHVCAEEIAALGAWLRTRLD